MEVVLFPFDKIKKKSRIILYGGGDVGKHLLKQIEATEWCEVIAIADRAAEKLKKEQNRYEFIVPKQINEYIFDKIVIAKKNEEAIKMISQLLQENGIREEKVIVLEDKYTIAMFERTVITPATADWNEYYEKAEVVAEEQYTAILQPLFDKYFDATSKIMDFACGKGRIVSIIKDKYKEIVCCDIAGEALNYCKERFENQKNILFVVSKDTGIEAKEESCEAIYSWDAMVHFDRKMLTFYLKEMKRIVKKGGYIIIHHSNLKEKSENWSDNKGFRSWFDMEDMREVAIEVNLRMVEQFPINWEKKNMDAITILEKEK